MKPGNPTATIDCCQPALTSVLAIACLAPHCDDNLVAGSPCVANHDQVS